MVSAAAGVPSAGLAVPASPSPVSRTFDADQRKGVASLPVGVGAAAAARPDIGANAATRARLARAPAARGPPRITRSPDHQVGHPRPGAVRAGDDQPAPRAPPLLHGPAAVGGDPGGGVADDHDPAGQP